LKRFYDTSVLVAVCQRNHSFHDAAMRAFLKASPDDSFCAAHSLAEFYSVMTSLPLRPRVAPEQGLLLVNSILERLSTVVLSAREYEAAIESCGAAGLAGGIVYDALLMSCARKVGADVVYTFNAKHFLRVAPDWEKRIHVPAQGS
jgi:predicted nucleic acid-binding protein